MTFDEWWKKEYAKLHAYDAAKKAWYAAIDQVIFQQQRLPDCISKAPEKPRKGTKMNLHHYYDQLTPAQKAAVDEAYVNMTATLKEHGCSIPGDDRAEAVVDAIAKGVLQENK